MIAMFRILLVSMLVLLVKKMTLKTNDKHREQMRKHNCGPMVQYQFDLHRAFRG
jgi:hypothetical protein